MKKKVIIAVICISVTLLFVILIFFLLRPKDALSRSFIEAFLPPPSAEKMERIFNRDQDDLFTIKDYFVESEYSELRIDISSYTKHPDMINAGREIGDVEIEDAEVLDAIKRLFEQHGYESISKDGNTIEFHEWSALLDNSRGIAYSINGIDEPDITFGTKLEPLDEEGWYYYEVDYNEWRKRHNAEMTS